MGHIYFIRHGQTVWNAEHRICGATDVGLTEQGRRQAAALGRKLAANGPAIDEILCSPLARARDTAGRVAAALSLPVRVEPRLREQCFGRFEGTLRTSPEFAEAMARPIYSFDGGESAFHVVRRVYGLLDELSADAGDVVRLLVSHDGVSRVVESYFRDMDITEFAAWSIPNCTLRRYDFGAR